MAKNDIDSRRWIDRETHRHWLAAEGLDLLEFYRASCLPGGGFGPLDGNRELASQTADTLITARMTHCYALATIQGVPGAATLAHHGVVALAGLLRDDQHDGWFATAPHDGFDEAKQCYIHVFVALGAASAVRAQIEGARALLDDVLAVLERYFWSEAEQAYVESWSRDWSELADYRGANANMHATEMCLELADVLDDRVWHKRALAITHRLIHRVAADHDWRVVEHFDANWRILPDYNADQPDDGFKPFGVTPGHGCEWARLLLHLEAGLGLEAPDWLADDARQLFDKAMNESWEADGQPGMVYTVDWRGTPSSTRRRHWTHAEAAAAAAALADRTSEARFEIWYRRLWDFMRDVYIDDERGSWLQELNAELGPDPHEGHLKPDLYHAYQATLLPRLPLTPTLALAVERL
ncbi:AGE family epimerase/isomerase [Salinisphaera hydrothermalis]|nr:AGE family epimerase/isomerase [Salinisphaera hydrothermalis]